MANIKFNTKMISLIFLAIILVFSFYSDKKKIKAFLSEFKLIPVTEKFTELYFSDHHNLPKMITANKKLSFSFTIHNLERADRVYPYTVYFKSEVKKTIIDQKNIFVKSEEVKILDVFYDPVESFNEGAVIVRLDDLNQEIHFLISDSQLL